MQENRKRIKLVDPIYLIRRIRIFGVRRKFDKDKKLIFPRSNPKDSESFEVDGETRDDDTRERCVDNDS